MATGQELLSRDLAVLEAMAAEIETYLISDVLFWQLTASGMPKMTLGGYLLRRYRLVSLRHLLAAEEQMRLDTAVARFDEVLAERIVRLEQKAHTELEARIRQWTELLNDVRYDAKAVIAGYPSHVETRAMIAAMVDQLQTSPYKLEKRLLSQVALLDQSLRQHWQPGPFIWPAAWQAAYPPERFWWLYGLPA